MNTPDLSDLKTKEARVRYYMDKNGYDALVIGRQDNFAWYTGGGNNRIVIPSEAGAAIIVVTRSRTCVIAQTMDGPRIFDEELAGLGMEPVFLRWYDVSREEKAEQLIKGLRTLSDIPLQGADYNLKEFYYKLHYPLTENDMKKIRWFGNRTEEIVRKVADEIHPGMTEHEVEAMFLYEYGKENMQLDVLLVGSDERISRYRHPNPSDKKIDKFVLLHPAARKWGVHSSITRMVHFGEDIPEDIIRKYDATCKIEAASMSMCNPGEKFCRVLEVQKELYRETGYDEEWRGHFLGGISAYVINDPTLCMDEKAELVANQAYNWYITITGVKVEEEILSTASGKEVVTVNGIWPVKEYSFNRQVFEIPQILIK